MSKVAFIGLGVMGYPMAGHIRRKGGHDVTVFNRTLGKAQAWVAEFGGHLAPTPQDAARDADFVLSCVGHDDDLRSVAMGDHGAFLGLKRGAIFIDNTTASATVAHELHAAAADRGAHFPDAPVSGGQAGAVNGKLTVMVGGDEAAVKRARPILEAFAGRIVTTGPVGAGHAMKLLNNFLSMGYAALYAEALMIGAKAGLSAEVFDSVIRGGRMDCPFYRTFFKYVLERDRDAHRFTIANAHKDVTYLAGFAETLGVANPLGAAVRNSFALAVGAGHGDGYVPMLSDYVAQWNGLPAPE